VPLEPRVAVDKSPSSPTIPLKNCESEDYYVSTNGSDNKECTIAEPCRTIGKVLSLDEIVTSVLIVNDIYKSNDVNIGARHLIIGTERNQMITFSDTLSSNTILFSVSTGAFIVNNLVFIYDGSARGIFIALEGDGSVTLEKVIIKPYPNSLSVTIASKPFLL
jgi:hypothetical protein